MNYTYKKIWLIAFPVMMSILIEQLINITDALFLGHVGDVELGASALAGIWFLAIYMLGFGHIDKKAYGLYWHIDITILKEVFSISVWSMLQFFTSVAIWFLFFVAIERLGEPELAVSNIVRSVSALFSVIVNSLAGVTSSLVSNLIGAGEKKKVFPLCHKIIRLGYATGIPLIALALFFHQPIIGAYTENPDIIQLAWLPFLVMLLNYFFALPGYVYLNATTGTGATRAVFIFQVTTTIAYLFCLWGLGYSNVPLATYWAVEYLYVILLGTQSVIYLKYKQY